MNSLSHHFVSGADAMVGLLPTVLELKNDTPSVNNLIADQGLGPVYLPSRLRLAEELRHATTSILFG